MVTSLKLSWSECYYSRGLSLFSRVPAVVGKTVYFAGRFNEVIVYDSEKLTWSELPKCPYQDFALVIIRGKLTTVGGQQYRNGKPTNALLSLRSRKCVESFPAMPTKRCGVAAICTSESLIVAGGLEGYKKVEVMNITTEQWSTASSLPINTYSSYITISRDSVYLMGGRIGSSSHLVLTCSLSALISSSHSLSPQTEVWHKVADAPVYESACAVVRGHLVAFGGHETLDKATTGVHMYDPHSDSWYLISNMPEPVGSSHVAVLPGNRVMVVDNSRSDCVQIGTLMY